LSVHELLHHIQQNLNATKGQYNDFGGYSYRSFEDILEAVKPLLKDSGAVIVASDAIEEIGGRVYVTARVSLMVGDETITGQASAREGDERKKMHPEQLTGSASSYARKYAAQGLFGIDDNKDADNLNTHGKLADKDATHFKRKVRRSLECYGDIEGLKKEAATHKTEAAELGLTGWLGSEYKNQEARIGHEQMDAEAAKMGGE